jgi:hypothetical protein
VKGGDGGGLRDDAKVMGPVVLHEEGSVLTHHVQDLFAARGRPLGPRRIGIVSQIQLLQPVLTIVWAALLLGENLTQPTLIAAVSVIACADMAIRTRPKPPSASLQA